MPVRKRVTKATKTVEEPQEAPREYSESDTHILPGVNAPRNYTPYYVLLLIVFAFLLGALTTKVSYLEGNKNGGTAQAAANTVTPPNGAAAQQPPQIAAHVDNVGNGHFPVLGQDSAPVTIVEFADPRCPFCKQFFTDTLPQLKTDYINTGKVKMYWRNFDFLGPSSTVAGNALECANEQGKFWDLHDYFYQNQPEESDTSMFTTDKLSTLAGTLGMDSTQFSSCLSANKDNNNVSQDLADGQKYGVSGTPTFFINGDSLVGAQPYSAIKTIIDQKLAGK